MPRHLIAFDLEATCWDEPVLREQQAIETEIIEIGAVRLDPVTRIETDRFQALIQPTRHPNLSPYCIQLTGIQQEEVHEASPFEVVWGQFHTWLGPSTSYELSAWGDFDHQQLTRQIREVHQEPPAWRCSDGQLEYVRWCRARGFHNRSRKLSRVIEDLNLTVGEAPHRALPDAERLAQVLCLLRDPQGRTPKADALLGLLHTRPSIPTHRGHARRALGMDKITFIKASTELVHLHLAIDLGDGQGLCIPPPATVTGQTITPLT